MTTETEHDSHDTSLRTIAKTCGLDVSAVVANVERLTAAGVPRGEARQRALTAALLLWPTTKAEDNPSG